jgi:hypothetical protein
LFANSVQTPYISSKSSSSPVNYPASNSSNPNLVTVTISGQTPFISTRQNTNFIYNNTPQPHLVIFNLLLQIINSEVVVQIPILLHLIILGVATIIVLLLLGIILIVLVIVQILM